LVPLLQSPSSPLSLMDIITVGSPVNLDSCPESSSSSVVTVTPAKPPQEERLLPIGPSRNLTHFPKPDATEAKDRLFEKFWQVLHKEGASEAEKLILEEKTEKVIFQAGGFLFD
jgi:hypothetical protein